MIQQFDSLPNRIDVGVDYEWAQRRRKFAFFVRVWSGVMGMLLGMGGCYVIDKFFS